MDFLHEMHKRAKAASLAHADKVYKELAGPKANLQAKAMFGTSTALDAHNADLYHLGSAKAAYNLYLDKNAHN